jgi:hypothetical protein
MLLRHDVHVLEIRRLGGTHLTRDIAAVRNTPHDWLSDSLVKRPRRGLVCLGVDFDIVLSSLPWRPRQTSSLLIRLIFKSSILRILTDSRLPCFQLSCVVRSVQVQRLHGIPVNSDRSSFVVWLLRVTEYIPLREIPSWPLSRGRRDMSAGLGPSC